MTARTMIRSFASADTAQLFHERRNRAIPSDIQRVALRKLAQLHAVTALAQLAVPPGNRLEALRGDRKGQHSIRINEIVKGRRALTADTAVRLARYFKWPAEVWLNLQANYDRQLAEDANRATLARIRPCSAVA